MFQLKKILSDIVKYTYGEACNPRYYKFYVEISNSNKKGFHGTYNIKTHKIIIYNTYRDDEAILCTTIHELAHHIDTCNRHNSDHQKPFYEEYRKLLYTAMDMGIINKWKFFESTKDASDSNKIRKMMDEYIPHPISYKSGTYIISVYHSYEHKAFLQSNGYYYNSNTKAWEKEVSDVEKEQKKVESLSGIKIEVRKATDFHFEGKIKLVIESGDSYSIKDKLKADGFQYENKKWVCYLQNKEMVDAIKRKYPMLIISQK